MVDGVCSGLRGGKQTFGIAPVVTVKFAAADDSTPPGAYSMTVPIGAPMLGQYSAIETAIEHGLQR